MKLTLSHIFNSYHEINDEYKFTKAMADMDIVEATIKYT